MNLWAKLKEIFGVPEDEFAPEEEYKVGTEQEDEQNGIFGQKSGEYYGSYGYSSDSSRRDRSRRAARTETRTETRNETRREPRSARRNAAGYENISVTANLQVILSKLDSYDDAWQVVDHLKARKTVLINVEGLDRDSVRRIVDLMAGAVYALGGDLKRVANATFIATPYDVDLQGDILDELKMGHRSIF